MGVPISNVTRRVVYAASGTGPYNFTFEILAASDIAVYRDDTLLTLTTNYTVTINANGTGYVTLTASPTGATQIAIVGNRTIQRTTDFVTGGDFFANTVNDELDQQTIFAQQNAEGLARALQAPQTDPTSINMTLPRAADRAGKYLAFDENGNPQPGDTAVEVSAVYAIRDEIAAVAAIDTEVVTCSENIVAIGNASSDAAAAASSATSAANSATAAAASAASAGGAEIVFTIEGGGQIISSGYKGTLEIPFNCTINRWTLLADSSGSITVDIQKSTYGNYPTASSITASATPSLTSTRKNQSSTLTGWTTSLSTGDLLSFVVTGVTLTVTRVVISIKVTRT